MDETQVQIARELSDEYTVVKLTKIVDGREIKFQCFNPIPDSALITCHGRSFVKMRTLKYAEYRYRCVDCGATYLSKEMLEPKYG